MAQQIKTKGIVLHEMPIGDYDKRLILLTKEEGKVTAFVKGARRPNNKLLACSQLFSYGEFILSKGKTSYNIYEANLIEHFHQLRLDIEVMTYGMYLLEFVNYVAHEEEENIELMQLLLYALNAMNQKNMEARLVIRVFELKAMSLLGYTPWVNDCSLCHKDESIAYFSVEQGGFICNDPNHIVPDRLKLHESTIYAIRYVLTKPIKEIFSFTLELDGVFELEYLMNQFVFTNLNKKFKALDFLKIL